jgi:hypothetical protein
LQIDNWLVINRSINVNLLFAVIYSIEIDDDIGGSVGLSWKKKKKKKKSSQQLDVEE